MEDGALTYNGRHWNDMSGQRPAARGTAIVVRKLNPACGFVLLDKLEQMDLRTLQEFGAWLQAEGLQAIATRVSTGGECQIIIEDGPRGRRCRGSARPQLHERSILTMKYSVTFRRYPRAGQGGSVRPQRASANPPLRASSPTRYSSTPKAAPSG